MGTILFLIMMLLGRKAQPNDYQWLAMLISLDCIALGIWVTHFCARRKESPGEES